MYEVFFIRQRKWGKIIIKSKIYCEKLILLKNNAYLCTL